MDINIFKYALWERKLKRRKKREQVLKLKMFQYHNDLETRINKTFNITIIKGLGLNEEYIVFEIPDARFQHRYRTVGTEQPVLFALGNMYHSLKIYNIGHAVRAFNNNDPTLLEAPTRRLRRRTVAPDDSFSQRTF